MATRVTVPGEAGAPRKRRSRLGDRLFRGTSLGLGLGIIVLLVVLLGVLASGGARAFSEFGLRFLTGRNWNPVLGREEFGALPFIFGTVVTSAEAVVMAVPVAVSVALLMNEGNLGWLRNPLAVFVDLLAAIPSVVYGLWGLFVMKPVFDNRIEPSLHAYLGRIPVIGSLFQPDPSFAGGDLFTAGVILAIMILPIVTAVTREIMATVPKDLREASLALGSTRWEMVRIAVLPYSRSGIVGASMLGLGRALGETIAVSMLVGNGLGIGPSLFRAGYTIPAVIASEFREATSVGVHRSALLGLAVVLVGVALLMAALSRLLVRRSQQLVGTELPPDLPAIAIPSAESGPPA